MNVKSQHFQCLAHLRKTFSSFTFEFMHYFRRSASYKVASLLKEFLSYLCQTPTLNLGDVPLFCDGDVPVAGVGFMELEEADASGCSWILCFYNLRVSIPIQTPVDGKVPNPMFNVKYFDYINKQYLQFWSLFCVFHTSALVNSTCAAAENNFKIRKHHMDLTKKSRLDVYLDEMDTRFDSQLNLFRDDLMLSNTVIEGEGGEADEDGVWSRSHLREADFELCTNLKIVANAYSARQPPVSNKELARQISALHSLMSVLPRPCSVP